MKKQVREDTHMYYIGIDLGGTNIKAGIVCRDKGLLHSLSVPTGAEGGAGEVIKVIGEAIKTLLTSAKLTEKDIAGLGIGSPGYIDSENGVVVYSNNLGWKDVKILRDLKAFIDVPSFINNDANAAALGEAVFGAGKNYGTSVFITLGTGVGGGVVLKNKLYEGFKSSGTELGHTKIGDKGHRCTCGRLDCWETYSSATALIRDTKQAMRENKDSEMWKFADGDIDKVDGRTSFECAKKGDKTALAVVENYILYLGDGLVNITNVFGAEAILIGGGVCAQGEYLTKPLQAHMDKFKYGGSLSPEVKILRATLGNDAGVLGAAALCFNDK
jgi:glucokinase